MAVELPDFRHVLTSASARTRGNRGRSPALRLRAGMPCSMNAAAMLAVRNPSVLRLRAHPLKIALVGNPNVGKSVVFGRLTGRYATVSNYPGTTVTITSGRALIGAEVCDVIDTPGVNALEGVLSEDERITKQLLASGGAELVVQVADARNLRRALMLTSQTGRDRAADDPRAEHGRRGRRARNHGRRRWLVGLSRHSGDRGGRTRRPRCRRAPRRAAIGRAGERHTAESA